MKPLLLTFAAASLMALPAISQTTLPAFPGAEGYGRYATGGRGGEIYHVTNLNDAGSGSFRDAISKSNRIIVFDVGGVIRLKSALVFKNNLTVLGQTAPGEGVQLYGARVSFSGANNIIVRHLRIRMGVNGDSGKDAAGVAFGRNMMFDHLSVLWGRDENFSINWDTKKTDDEPTDITIQNSIIGQGLQPHSCGGLIQTNGGVTLFRNLYIENKTRNPKVKGVNQFVNNVLCNWGNGAAYNMGGDSAGDSYAEITGNYFMRGPWKSAARPLSGGNSNFFYYGDDNYYDSNLNGVFDGEPLTDADYSASGGRRASSLEALDAESPKPHPVIESRMSAVEAFDWVARYVGPCLPVRDEVDQYLIDQLLSYGKKGSSEGISSEMQLPHKGTGTLFAGYKPLDTDKDGIPDEWEIANGLNPNDAKDAAAIADNGYANIENYSFTIDSPYPYLKNPTGLHAVAYERDAIAIAWTDNCDSEVEFVVEISSDGKTFAKALSVPADTRSCRIEGLEADKEYYVRVKAVDASGLESVYSDVLKTVTIDAPFPPEVSVLVAPEMNSEAKRLDLKLKWSNPTKDYFGQTRYDVLLGDDLGDMNCIAWDITETELNPGLLEPGKKYYWRVDATNDIGVTEGDVWSFSLVDGGTLFYTDFDKQPQSFADSEWGDAIAGSQADMLKAGSVAELEFDNMTVGTNGGRVVSFGNLKASSYAPYSTSDAGASDRAIGFIGKNGKVSKSYILINEIEGPWTITLYVGNSDAASLTFDVSADGESTPLATFNVAASKKSFKFTHTCTRSDVSTIRIGNVYNSTDKKGMNFFDIKVEQYVDPENSVGYAEQVPVCVETAEGTVTVNNLEAGAEVALYSVSGALIGRQVSAAGGSVSFAPGSGIYIVAVKGHPAVKAIL